MVLRYSAVRTREAGVISGRDAIFLDKIKFPNLETLKLYGSFNAALCDGLDDKLEFVPYNLLFKSVVWLKLNELDFVGLDGIEPDETSSNWGESSFDMILNSSLIEKFQNHDHSAKITTDHKHYVLYTYDIVFGVIATDYCLTLGQPEP